MIWSAYFAQSKVWDVRKSVVLVAAIALMAVAPMGVSAQGFDKGGTGNCPTECLFDGPCVKAVTLEVTCDPGIVNSTDILTFTIAQPLSGIGCAATRCDEIFSVTLTCQEIYGPNGDCTIWSRPFFISQLVQRLNLVAGTQVGAGMFCADVVNCPTATQIFLKSTFDFDCCVSSDEFGLPAGEGYPLTEGCPVSNLCNGVPGDEQITQGSGLGLTKTLAPCPTTPTPTCIPNDPICQAATITFGCAGDLEPGTFSILVSIPPVVGPTSCDPFPCGAPLTECVIDCTALRNNAELRDCTDIVNQVAIDFANCLNTSLGNILQATPLAVGDVCITAATHLLFCASGSELGSDLSGLGNPLIDDCSLVNLCDGNSGNEGSTNLFTNGLSINYQSKPGPTHPTPTPTCDPADPVCQAATVTIDCTGVLGTDADSFVFKIFPAPALPPIPCLPGNFGSSLVDCQIDCADLRDQLVNNQFINDCTDIRNYIAIQVSNCINAAGGGILQATPIQIGDICITSTIPFLVGVCGDEFVNCNTGLTKPLLENCSLVNLCDDVDGNEDPSLSFDNGISINYREKPGPEHPTPTPTCDPAAPFCESATIVIDCTGGGLVPGMFNFIVSEAPPTPVTSCGPQPCGQNQLATCEIDCTLIANLPILDDCTKISTFVASQLASCLNVELPGIVTAIPVGNGKICVLSTERLLFCVCGDELVPCDSGLALPITEDCGLVNICDGVSGNEGPTSNFTSGLSINYFRKPGPDPTPTPTATCDPAAPFCRAATITIDCTGDEVMPGSFTVIASLPPALPPTLCIPTACDMPVVQCVIDCQQLSSLPGVNDCTSLVEAAADQLAACLNTAPGGVISATRIRGGEICVLMQSPLSFCACGDEFVDCSSGLAMPIDVPGCGLVNLCDGVNGNEGPAFSFTGGFSINYEEKPGPAPTPTNTAVPTDTPVATNTPGVTNTPVASNTPAITNTPINSNTPAPTATNTEVPGCDSGYYILDSLGGRHRVGNPYIITGSLYFGTNIARDLERAVCDIGGVTNEDFVVLDGLGVSHFVQSPACDIPQDYFFPLIGFPQGRAVDVVVSADSDGLWVLTDFGGIYRAGSTKDPADPDLVPNTDNAGIGFDVPLTGSMRDSELPDHNGDATLRGVSLIVIDEDSNNRAEGYVVLDSMGGRLHYNPDGTQVTPGSSAGQTGNEPARLLDPTGYVWPFFVGLDIARDMELHPSQGGVVILDGWDGIHPVPVDVDTNPVFFANNVVSGSDPTPAQTVGLPYVVFGFNNPDTAGEDEGDAANYGIDAQSIFTDLEFSAGCPDTGLYTLDKFGGVFVLGEAREIESEPVPQFGDSPYFFPFLYAEAIEIFASDEAEPEETTMNP